MPLFVLSPPPAAAEPVVDRITIKDGSILKGEIKRVENHELILDTDYADDVVIEVEYIVDIESKQHFSVRLISGEIISGFLAVSEGKIVLRERLPAPDEPGAAKESDFKERPRKESPTELDLGTDEVVQQATPDDLQQDDAADEFAKPTDEQASRTAENPLQQTTPDALQRNKETVEIAESADSWSAENPSGAERPDGRQFSFDDVD